MAVMGVSAKIMCCYLNQTHRPSAIQNAVLEAARKEVGKDTNDVESHR
jgi:hypothetical protein